MKIKLVSLAVVFIFCAAFNLAAQTKVAPQITAIRAQLYHDANGTFSDDVLATKDILLWNSITGDEASTSTFVVVEISGKDLPVSSLKVEITATGDKNRLIQKKVVAVEIYDARTKFFAPFWLYDTGCEQINISARLIGKGAPLAPVKKKIPFRCGE